MDPCHPERFVGVDVADAGNGPLAQQVGLNRRPRARKIGDEPVDVEVVRERLGAERRQRRQRPVIAALDDCDTAEATGVPENQGAPIVEPQPGSDPGIVVIEPEGAGHAEMKDQLESLIERRYQELALPTHAMDLPPHHEAHLVELARHGRDRVPPRVGDGSAAQLGVELTPDGFDLWQLGHGIRLVPMGDERATNMLAYVPGELARKADVGSDAFFAVDMRVGVVREVRDFPQARKPAYKLRVDLGPVVGDLWTSAQVTNYSKEELVGRKVVGAINLGSRRIAGFESQFLVLGSIDPDGTVLLLAVDDRAEPGAPIA
jgi:tRNA-binding protein